MKIQQVVEECELMNKEEQKINLNEKL